MDEDCKILSFKEGGNADLDLKNSPKVNPESFLELAKKKPIFGVETEILELAMVCAAELNVGEFVDFFGEIVEITDVQPVIPPEIGPDGRSKLQIEVTSSWDGTTKTYIAAASEEFQLENAPGSDSAAGSRRRAGVSSEPGVGADTLQTWKKVVIPKTPEERENIRALVKHNVFFDHLEETEENELIDVVFDRRFEAGDTLMKEGDEGDHFYVIESGEADIFVANENGNDVLVRQCKPGDSFGELSLMYNAPRNATVKARTPLRCWCMDRNNFKFVIMGGNIRKQERYMAFLEGIQTFGTMDTAERMKLVDALIPRKVSAGSTVVRQGDIADMFYIVEKGALNVAQLTPNGEQEVVNIKTAGDYFGEIALIADIPRSATVTAVEDCVLLTVDRKTFVSIVGPIEPLIRRNVALYKTYVDYTNIATEREGANLN
jgi:cAMP-dependent protein kinase regulator